MRKLRWCLLLVPGFFACETTDPVVTTVLDGGTPVSDSGLLADAGDASNAMCFVSPTVAPDATGCMAAATDYKPRENASMGDTWAACISDDNAYHPIGMDISTVPRVTAFETIATKLGFGTGKAPTAAEFLEARVAYAQPEGIESRVSRREDEHYPAASKACRDMNAAEIAMNPNRCVGQAKIQPIVNAAFTEGAMGVDSANNAARLEAAFLWFFYTSVFKEATTGASTAVDVDSSWAYYTGGQDRAGAGLGFSRYVKSRSVSTHDRIWDGLLAQRCWRFLDNPTGAAMNLTMRDQARAQTDRAMLRGLAVIVRDHVARTNCAQSDILVSILGPVLLRDAKARNMTGGAALELALTEKDKQGILASLDALFACP